MRSHRPLDPDSGFVTASPDPAPSPGERPQPRIDVARSLSPGRLRVAARAELTSTLRDLRRSAVVRALKGLPREQRMRGGLLLVDLEAARQDLIAAELADLRDALEANDSDLRREIARMREARCSPERIQELLRAAERLLASVQRVVDVAV